LNDQLIESFYGQGHKNLLATHRTTIEITKENFLTKNGNCIIGINAQKSCFDLALDVKEKLKNGKKFRVLLRSEQNVDSFTGYGHNNLTLCNRVSMVFRKSNYICDRTVMINCSKSAIDLDRNLINSLQSADTHIIVEIYEDT